MAELDGLKMRQQAAWATGDYAVIGSTILITAELLAEALDVRSGWGVLDVAAGNGNMSLAAARRGCRVTSTDFVPALLERGKARAAAEGWRIEFEVADAENLQFADGSFDCVVSTFGVMFTPDQEKTASELMRVCRPGGKIGLANWTPTSFVGRMFRLIGKYVPPQPGLSSPSLWGTEERLNQLFAGTWRSWPSPAGIVCFARGRSGTGWTDFASITGRCSERSRRSTRQARRRSRPICWRSPAS